MDWQLYFFSILGGINGAGVITLVLGICAMAISVLVAGANAGRYGEEDLREPAKKAFRISVVAVVVSMAITTFVPTPRSLLHAYLLVEGRKVINAPNAEKAADEFVKRLDMLIEKLPQGDQ